MQSIPDDIYLPHGWLCRCCTETAIAFTREDADVSLLAEKTDDPPHIPGFDPGYAWELRCRQQFGEAESTRSLGYVSTQRRAFDALLSCIKQYNAMVDEEDEGEVSGAVVNRLTIPGNAFSSYTDSSTGHH